MKDRVEIIARTERRRKFSDVEKAVILAEADPGFLLGQKAGFC